MKLEELFLEKKNELGKDGIRVLSIKCTNNKTGNHKLKFYLDEDGSIRKCKIKCEYAKYF